MQKQSELETKLDSSSSSKTDRSATQSDPNEAVFRNLIEAARCMIVILRRDRTVAYFNPFAEELTGRTWEEVRGKDYLEVFVPTAVREEVGEYFHRAFSGTANGEFEYPLLAKGAPIRRVNCSLRAFGDYQGEPAVLLTAQDVTVHRHTEDKLQQRTHDLGERVKELNCLFGLSKLVEEFVTDLDGILQGLVDILPPGWQYPTVTCGRVIFENREFKTFNFKETQWKQDAPITVHGKPMGVIEVYYLEEKRPLYEGPFLIEERRLLDALAKQLGRIAERIKAEKELRRERDFAESLINTAPAIVLVLDIEGRILRINPYMEEISGHRLEDVKGKDWFRTFLPERNRNRMRRMFARTADDKQRRGYVEPIVSKNGREREIEWYDKRLEDASGTLIGLLAIGQDITERRKLEKEISEISTKEQQRIGQELHDGLGQELTGLGYLAETLYCDLQRGGLTESAMANDLASGIENTLEQARNIAKGLVPVEIASAGLVSAIEQLAASTENRCGIKCRFHGSQPAPVADTAIATQLFRIVQEAINNAAKHARARTITIELKTDDDQIVFEVRDDGVGISNDTEQATGMGLRIMNYRAGVIGATLNIGVVDGGGTVVTCSLPRNG